MGENKFVLWRGDNGVEIVIECFKINVCIYVFVIIFNGKRGYEFVREYGGLYGRG